jgi:hypothetical protein
MASVNITALNTALGAYARQEKVEIFNKILRESTAQYFTTVTGAIDQLPLAKLTTASVLKPYAAGGGFTATDDALVFGARILNARRISADVEIVPLDLYNSWLGQLAGAPPASPFDIPFEQFIMDAIAKQAQDDLEGAIWNGTYNSSGTTSAATMDGVLKLVKAAVTSGEIPAGNVTTFTAITSSNALDEVKKVRAKIAAQYRNKPMYCFLSVANFDNYMDDYQSSVGSVVYNRDYNQVFIEGTQTQLVAIPGMVGTDSNRILITPKDNLVFGYDIEGAASNIITQEYNRTIKVMMDFRAGVNFRDGGVIFCNGNEA